MRPELSVIIPTYKRAESLERVLDCLMTQENIGLEIIVVDQNEPGFFKENVTSKLGEVIHIVQPMPNASLARNTGYKKSTAPYILFLDDDLIPEANFCKNGFDIFKDYPLIKSFVPLVYSLEGKEFAFLDSKKKMIRYYPNHISVFSITEAISAAVFFERSYFVQSGGFDTHLFEFAKTSEDMELFLRMLKRNMVLWFVPHVKIFHDEKVAGGCELRTANYWISRKKNIRALVFRNRIHNPMPGNISIEGIIRILRSSVINKKILKSGIKNIIKEIKLLTGSIKESNNYFLTHKNAYQKKLITFIED